MELATFIHFQQSEIHFLSLIMIKCCRNAKDTTSNKIMAAEGNSKDFEINYRSLFTDERREETSRSLMSSQWTPEDVHLILSNGRRVPTDRSYALRNIPKPAPDLKLDFVDFELRYTVGFLKEFLFYILICYLLTSKAYVKSKHRGIN